MGSHTQARKEAKQAWAAATRVTLVTMMLSKLSGFLWLTLAVLFVNQKPVLGQPILSRRRTRWIQKI